MSIIETKRLVLRPFREGDAEMMYRNWTFDEHVAKYCRWYPHENVEVTKELLKMYLDEAAQGFEYRWAITLRGGDEPIGAIDVVGVSEDGKSAKLGYVLSHKYWGQGIMTETLKTVIRTLFRRGFTEVTACHHADNPASGRVMEKCGMRFIGTAQAQEKFGSDKTCEVKCYSIKEGTFGA